ncbi:MAG: type IV pilus assembly protein PilM [Akkermansiaceae bacterium]|nr:type IV pilus assembly protein PilM [Akkermansiaceae bacterium]MDP4646677.1 type IV pilus assembly protein PilM [Akkermansiaceae bacterium]MDP4779593.1 type IV pilus assembly protein PilM [Akkermansiaceae bacterium]MDP4896907.1 type IV pilus assembly protein PilM [Akkermansiaceae bacterium]
MADTHTTVALNIGSQRIGMAVFETSKSGGLILKGYETDTIVADPTFEASREAQIRASIEDLGAKLKVPKSKLRYAISGQAAFIRFVKLPPIQDDNIEQLVTFEAQQHVPFPINEVAWDYEMIEGSAEKEVVIVAIKGDALEETNDTVNEAGHATIEVDVAPMALFNAYRDSYGVPDEPTLIIDVGAKTSNLIYVEGSRFFTRSVAIGGATATAAIAKEYGITFQEAEQQKIANGLVALGGGHTETMDEAVAALAMVIRDALTRLPAEIARTTNYYRSQHGGSAPKRILLAGGGANLPYTLEFIAEKLNLPVEYFNPLAHVSIGKGVDTQVIQQDAHTMGELIGLGLRGNGKSTINIDLVPSAVEIARASDRRKPFLIAAAALLVFGFGTWAFLQNSAANKAEDRARTMGETKEVLVPFELDIRALLKKEAELSAVASQYTGIETDHALWFDLLGELRGAFASDAVWMTEMSPLYDFSPVADNDSPASSRKFNKVVDQAFTGDSFSGSAITGPPAPPQQGNSKGNNRPQAQPKLTANAILIRGFWRENPRSQNAVSDLLKRLRENSTAFVFTVKDKNNKDVVLADEQILVPSAVGEEGDLAFPFELTLPLARPLQVK